MPTINLDDATFDRLGLVAAALDKSHSQAVAHLLHRLSDSTRATPHTELDGSVDIHVVYKGERVDASFDTRTECISISSGPLAGRRYGSPSEAARAVVSSIRPDVSPNRNGWGFWIINADGVPLQNLRRKR